MDINECYLQLIENQDEVRLLEEKIDNERKKYESNIKGLREQIQIRKKEISELKDMAFSIRLGDLIDELGWLSETKVCNINILLETNVLMDGIHELNELVELVNIKNVRRVPFCMRLRLWNNNLGSVMFDYFTFLSLDFNNIYCDKNKMIEHCSVVIKEKTDGGYYTELVIDKDIMNIICNFNLKYIESCDQVSWYPADLFSQAIITCSQRDYDTRVDKIRKRIK